MNLPHFVLLDNGRRRRLGISSDIPAPGSTFGPPNRVLYLETRVPAEKKIGAPVGHYPFRTVAVETDDLSKPVRVGFYSTPPKEPHINLFQQHPGGLDAPINKDSLSVWHEKDQLHVENLSGTPIEISLGNGVIAPGESTALVSGVEHLILRHADDPTVLHFLSLETVNRTRTLQIEQMARKDIQRERTYLKMEGEKSADNLPSNFSAHAGSKYYANAEKAYRQLPVAKKVTPKQ